MTSSMTYILLPVVCILCFMPKSYSLVHMYINTTEAYRRVDPTFISVTLDFSLLNATTKWAHFDFSSKRVKTLLSGLSPGYMRLGGTCADFTVFSPYKKTTLGDMTPTITPPLITISDEDLDNLVKLTNEAGFRLLYEFNLQLRYGEQWDPTNALAIIQYMTNKGYGDNLHFELGNEPDYYSPGPFKGLIPLNGTRIGQDYHILRDLLLQFSKLRNCSVVGPDTTNPDLHNIFPDFVKTAGRYINAVTIHHYYFSGSGASVKDYIDPKHFANLESFLENCKDKIQTSPTPDLPLWLGETSDAYSSGTPNITNRYVSGFLWLEKLGLSAYEGVEVVMRQAFYGGFYSLIDLDDLTPNPDYWLSFIHNTLVGSVVFNKEVKMVDDKLTWRQAGDKRYTTPQHVRLYVQCTKPSSTYVAGAITVFGLNVHTTKTEAVMFNEPLSKQLIDLYLLTPDGAEGLVSRYVALNGKRLQMVDDYNLPDLVPTQQAASSGVTLPPTTFGFVVFPEANVAACKPIKH